MVLAILFYLFQFISVLRNKNFRYKPCKSNSILKWSIQALQRTYFFYLPFLGEIALRAMTLSSVLAQAYIFLYDSRPFSVSLSQCLGLDNSSLTVPCDSPNTCLANSLWPMLWALKISLILRATSAVSSIWPLLLLPPPDDDVDASALTSLGSRCNLALSCELLGGTGPLPSWPMGGLLGWSLFNNSGCGWKPFGMGTGNVTGMRGIVIPFSNLIKLLGLWNG